MDAPLRVHTWPQSAGDALAALHSDAGCVVISVHTPVTENRALARESIRMALRELLAAYWARPVESIQFCTHLGQPLTLLSPNCPVGLSVSHAPGCSVAAVHLHGAVGIDVMRFDAAVDELNAPLPGWAPLTRDYMDPLTYQLLLNTAPALRGSVFAQAWCQLEAGLKCLGVGLTEWTPPLALARAQCRVIALDMPSTLCGALALRPIKP